MAKPKYVKNRDGQFAGSIGEGKTNVPTIAPDVIVLPETEPRQSAADYLDLYESFQESFEDEPDGQGSIRDLVGANVDEIYWSDRIVTFATDKGLISYQVYGDCCSSSYFHDMIGVKKLLENGPVIDIESVNLKPGDPGHPDSPEFEDPDVQAVHDALQPDEGYDDDVVQVYGYRITTEDPTFGPVSTVLAFRNSSNGYYGGWMERVKGTLDEKMLRLTDDYLGD